MFVPTSHKLIVRIDTRRSKVVIEPSGAGKNLHIETYIKDYLAKSFQDSDIGWEVLNTQLLPSHLEGQVELRHHLIVTIDTSHSKVFIEPLGAGKNSHIEPHIKNLHIETYILEYLNSSFRGDDMGWEVLYARLLPCAAYSINGIKIEEGRQKK